jgi:hypothetical protein
MVLFAECLYAASLNLDIFKYTAEYEPKISTNDNDRKTNK